VTLPVRRRGTVTRRDLLLALADLSRHTKTPAAARARALPAGPSIAGERPIAGEQPIADKAKAQSQAARPVQAPDVQLALPLDDATAPPSGLPEMTVAEQVRAELEVLGLDATRHVLTCYEPLLAALGVTRARDLPRCRSRAELLVAGVKVATQTPPIRSGRRVVFITLDDATGPVDATLFEDAQAGYAATVFHSWLLVVRGTLRRTGPRGISLNASGAWELSALYTAWESGGLAAVDGVMQVAQRVSDAAVHGAAESRSTRPVMTRPPVGGAARVYASGFAASPYADIRPAGVHPSGPPRKLWHSSPGSSGA
jgi:error-prone DNA polymerase